MNDPLEVFIRQYREPATTAELWCELSMVKRWSEAKDLPATFIQLENELWLLERAGRVVCVEGKWGLVVREPVKERMLFA